MRKEAPEADNPPGAQNQSAKRVNIASHVMVQAQALRDVITALEKLREEHTQAGSMSDAELQVAGSTTQHLTSFLVESFLDNVVGSPNGLVAWYTDPAHPERKQYLLQILP